jgi:enterochelin esterase-like enzyme
MRRRLLIVCLILGLAAAAIPVAVALGSDADSQTHGQIDPELEATVGQATGGRLTTVHFYSHALHKVADYLVYLPAGYAPTRPLPVFYLLHGMPGKPVAFTVNADIELRLQKLIRAQQAGPMILVFPDGRIDGRIQSDSEWANTPSGRYESYVTDVVQNVDQRFGTLACRQQRAIAGLSAGAYGAANVGLHQDATFGLVQVWSGYFRETHNGVFANADRAVMDYNSPIDYVHTMRGTLERYPLRIFIYGGRDDPDTPQIPAMAQALKDEGAHESWAIYPGGHSWKTWTPHVDQMLIMASDDFAHPLGKVPAACEAHEVAAGQLSRQAVSGSRSPRRPPAPA